MAGSPRATLRSRKGSTPLGRWAGAAPRSAVRVYPAPACRGCPAPMGGWARVIVSSKRRSAHTHGQTAPAADPWTLTPSQRPPVAIRVLEVGGERPERAAVRRRLRTPEEVGSQLSGGQVKRDPPHPPPPSPDINRLHHPRTAPPPRYGRVPPSKAIPPLHHPRPSIPAQRRPPGGWKGPPSPLRVTPHSHEGGARQPCPPRVQLGARLPRRGRIRTGTKDTWQRGPHQSGGARAHERSSQRRRGRPERTDDSHPGPTASAAAGAPPGPRLQYNTPSGARTTMRRPDPPRSTGGRDGQSTQPATVGLLERDEGARGATLRHHTHSGPGGRWSVPASAHCGRRAFRPKDESAPAQI